MVNMYREFYSLASSVPENHWSGIDWSTWSFGLADESYDTIKGWPLQILINSYTAYRSSHNVLWIEMPEDFYDLGFGNTLIKHTGMNLDTLYSDFTNHMKNYDKQMLSKKVVFFWN